MFARTDDVAGIVVIVVAIGAAAANVVIVCIFVFPSGILLLT